MLGRRVARQAIELGLPVIVVGSNSLPYRGMDLRLVGDVHRGYGPLSGLHAALREAATPWVYLLACDMPFMGKAWLESLIELAEGEGRGKRAIAAERHGNIEPFHALYARSLLPELDELFEKRGLEPKRYSMTSFMRGDRGLIVPEAVAASFCPGWTIFRGINNAEELAALSSIQGLGTEPALPSGAP